MSESESTKITFREILVAFDASHHSTAALESAVAIAKLMNARLRGIFVHEIQWEKISMLPEAAEINELTGDIESMNKEDFLKKAEALEKRVREYFASISNKNRLPFNWETKSGSVTENVLEAARKADLITIGSSGSSAITQKTLGSTAVALINETEKPVLIMRKGLVLGNTVSVLFDGTEAGLKSVTTGLHFSGFANTRCLIINASKYFHPDSMLTDKLTNIVNSTSVKTKLFEMKDFNTADLIYQLCRYRSGLIVLPKTEPFTSKRMLGRFLTSVQCPILLMNG